MKQIGELSYQAEEGYTFVRISDGVRFGNGLYLGNASIEEFEEQPMTEEELVEENRRKELFDWQKNPPHKVPPTIV